MFFFLVAHNYILLICIFLTITPKERYKNDPIYRKKVNARNRAWDHAHRKDQAKKRKDYFKAYNADPERKKLQKELNKQYLADAWGKVFNAYGRTCACCGESNPAFLTVDHVNGDGRKDRLEMTGRSSGSGCYTYLLRMVKENNPSKYQILCFNCNCGRQYRSNGTGICPHKAAVLS